MSNEQNKMVDRYLDLNKKQPLTYRQRVAKIIGCKEDQVHLLVLPSGRGGVLYEEEPIFSGKSSTYYAKPYSGWLIGRYALVLESDSPEAGYFTFSSTRCLRGTRLAEFELYEMPHCCGIMVSCGSCVQRSMRGKGLGGLLNEVRESIGRSLGYTIMLCTDKSDNTPQRKILQKNRWQDIYAFTNKRTRNNLLISIKEL